MRYCERCGELAHNGEGKIVAMFSLAELTDIAYTASLPTVRQRAINMIALLDEELAEHIRQDLREAGLYP